MGDTSHEEITDPDGFRDDVEQSVGMLFVARPGVPAVPAAGGDLRPAVCRSLPTRRSLRPVRGRACRDPRAGNLRAGAYTLNGRRPTMKKLLTLTILGTLLLGATGCHMCDGWRDSWCGRCRPRQTVVVAEPCMVESCSPCSSCGTCGTCSSCAPCATCGSPCAAPCPTCTTTPVLVPGPVIAH